jgi:hypothetical protein
LTTTTWLTSPVPMDLDREPRRLARAQHVAHEVGGAAGFGRKSSTMLSVAP